jgi:endonuclease/exonuclease/phosphatase family metal-dependent hydrolase
LTAGLGRRLTAVHPLRFRGAFEGQANAVLLSPSLRALEQRTIVLNPIQFRRVQARWLRLHPVFELAWAKERRVCQAVRLRLHDGRTALVANLHATSSHERRIPDAELLRAATFADGLAAPGEICVLAGDFNVSPAGSRTLADLAAPEWGFSPPGAGIDHVLVRGAEAGPLERWSIQRRRFEGYVLSDHAPVEVRIS